MDHGEHYSYPSFDAALVRAIEILQPKTILDIGAGDGKVGKVLRTSPLIKDACIIALEPDSECNPRLKAAGYDEVINEMTDYLYDHPDGKYDVIILGDVIEHLKHSDGRDLIEFLSYRCGYMFIITPDCMPMLADRFHIGHNSFWRPNAFDWCDLWAHARYRVLYFYILRGFQNWGITPLWSLTNQMNAEQIAVCQFDDNYAADVLNLHFHSNLTSDVIAGDAVNSTVYRPL